MSFVIEGDVLVLRERVDGVVEETHLRRAPERKHMLTERGFQYATVEVSPAGEPVVYRFGGALSMDGAPTYFPAVDERAAAVAAQACADARGLSSYEALPCKMALEIALAGVGQSVREAEAANPAQTITRDMKLSLAAELDEELEDACASATLSHELDPEADLGGDIANAVARACVAASVDYFATL